MSTHLRRRSRAAGAGNSHAAGAEAAQGGGAAQEEAVRYAAGARQCVPPQREHDARVTRCGCGAPPVSFTPSPYDAHEGEDSQGSD